MNASRAILWRTLSVFAAAVAILVTGAVASAAEGDARLAWVFQDNMVLQRDAAAPVWGWAAPGAAVEVSFAGQTKQAKAGDDGYWKVALDPMPASAEGRDLDVRIGDVAVKRKNVLVGEVWIAAGQSNMNAGGPDEPTGVYPFYVSPKTAGKKPDIRVMQFGWGSSLEPLPDADPALHGDGAWEIVADPFPKSTNLSRYFARVVRDGLDVPVGIIHVAVSGTNQAAWMSRKALESFPGGDKGNFYDQFFATMEGNLGKSKGEIKSWADFKKADDEWRAAGAKGQWPGRAVSATISDYPTALYNTRIHPLAPFAIRGVIWHQGEAGPGGPYGARLVAMAKQWRELFGQDFYFVWGTLSRHTVNQPPLDPALSWFYRSNTNVEIRKALGLFGDDKKVALVDFYDLGDQGTHFLQKAEAGRRMGYAALTVAYGQNHIYTGPLMVDAKIEGNKATLKFAHVGKGLVYTPSIDGISGVIVKDKKGGDHWADVKVVDSATIEVSSPDVSEIAGVAYAVAPNPHETLFGSEGLPASPVRLDAGNIPYKTEGPQLLTFQGGAKGTLNLAHVRRDGYVFQLDPGRGPKDGKATVQAYVGKEWDSAEVTVAGKPVEAKETTQDGRRYVTFEVPVHGAWVIVAAKGKAGEFAKVNRF